MAPREKKKKKKRTACVLFCVPLRHQREQIFDLTCQEEHLSSLNEAETPDPDAWGPGTERICRYGGRNVAGNCWEQRGCSKTGSISFFWKQNSRSSGLISPMSNWWHFTKIERYVNCLCAPRKEIQIRSQQRVTINKLCKIERIFNRFSSRLSEKDDC